MQFAIVLIRPFLCMASSTDKVFCSVQQVLPLQCGDPLCYWNEGQLLPWKTEENLIGTPWDIVPQILIWTEGLMDFSIKEQSASAPRRKYIFFSVGLEMWQEGPKLLERTIWRCTQNPNKWVEQAACKLCSSCCFVCWNIWWLALVGETRNRVMEEKRREASCPCL